MIMTRNCAIEKTQFLHLHYFRYLLLTLSHIQEPDFVVLEVLHEILYLEGTLAIEDFVYCTYIISIIIVTPVMIVYVIQCTTNYVN
jgi:hypothetical protein